MVIRKRFSSARVMITESKVRKHLRSSKIRRYIMPALALSICSGYMRIISFIEAKEATKKEFGVIFVVQRKEATVFRPELDLAFTFALKEAI